MINENNYYLTVKRRAQLKIAYNILPDLIARCDDFKYDMCNVTIDRINKSKTNNIFNISYVDDITIINFSGYLVDSRVVSNTSYIIYPDDTINKIATTHRHWGFSDLKFMPYTIEKEISLYDANGKIIYTRINEDITYNKSIMDGYMKIGTINDPKRSGKQSTEIFYLNDNDEYIKMVTNIRNKAKYYIYEHNVVNDIDQPLFMSKLDDFSLRYGKQLVKR